MSASTRLETARIAVVIPAYRAARFVGAAVRSVLDQDVQVPVEAIVVDDGSDDATAAAAHRAGAAAVDAAGHRTMRVVEGEHAGAGAARNTGVGMAGAARRAAFSHLAFVDADDLWTTGSLGIRLDVLQADPAVDAVFGRMIEFDDATGVERDPAPAWSAGTMLIRTSAFWRVGRFDERWPAGEFIDWFARAEEAGLRMLMLDAVVLRRRIHDANTTRGGAARRAYPAVLAEIRRRRSNGTTPPLQPSSWRLSR